MSAFIGVVTTIATGNPVLGGMAAGAVSGAFTGNITKVLQGAGKGGLYGVIGPAGMAIAFQDPRYLIGLDPTGMASLGYAAATGNFAGAAGGFVGSWMGRDLAAKVQDSSRTRSSSGQARRDSQPSETDGSDRRFPNDVQFVDFISGTDAIYYPYTAESTTENKYLQVDLGQGVRVWVQNVDVWPTTVIVHTNFGQDSAVLPWGASQYFHFTSPFREEPIPWRIHIFSDAESFSVRYTIESTWVPWRQKSYL